MSKSVYENIYKNGILVGRQEIPRRENLVNKIKRAGNWKPSMIKLRTKQLTSFCGRKDK